MPNTKTEIETRCHQGHQEVNGFLLTFLQVNRTCEKLPLQWKVLHHMGCQGRHGLWANAGCWRWAFLPPRSCDLPTFLCDHTHVCISTHTCTQVCTRTASGSVYGCEPIHACARKEGAKGELESAGKAMTLRSSVSFRTPRGERVCSLIHSQCSWAWFLGGCLLVLTVVKSNNNNNTFYVHTSVSGI